MKLAFKNAINYSQRNLSFPFLHGGVKLSDLSLPGESLTRLVRGGEGEYKK